MADTGVEWIEMPPPGAMPAPLALFGALGELTLDHVGIAVRDVDEAMRRFGRDLGIHDWIRSTFATTSVYRGEDQRIGGHVATASMGRINIELVQPTDGSWTPVDVLRTKGEGLYHMGFRVPDVDDASRRMKDAGLQVALLGTHGDTPLFVYTESEDLFGVCIELVGPRMPKGMVTAAVPVP
jgi:catechol 2,3-dioxygenase-like lactoylglutathione lyase family enzyme